VLLALVSWGHGALSYSTRARHKSSYIHQSGLPVKRSLKTSEILKWGVRSPSDCPLYRAQDVLGGMRVPSLRDVSGAEMA